MSVEKVDVNALSERVVDSILKLDSPYERRRPAHDVRRNVAVSAMMQASQQVRSPNEFFGSLFHAVLAVLSFVFVVSLTGSEPGVPLFLFALALFVGLGGSFAFFWFPEQREKRRRVRVEIEDLAAQIEELALQDLRKRNRLP